MKFFICAFALVAVASAAPQFVAYNPEVISPEGRAQILDYQNNLNGDGSYKWSFKTANGISAGEKNVPTPAEANGEPAPNVEGGYDYTAPNGEPVFFRYTAGKQGFVASGSHIPVAPPIPQEILEALAWNAAHPEEEAYWDPANPKAQLYYQGGQ